MKNCLVTCLLLLFILVSHQGFSQKKNSVKFYSQDLDFLDADVSTPNLRRNGFHGRYSIRMNSILGVSYERLLSDRIGAGGQYTFWWGKSIFSGYKEFETGTNFEVGSAFSFQSVGKQISGYEYRSFDVYGFYSLPIRDKVKFDFKIGPSVTSGVNGYLVHLSPNYPGAPDYVAYTEEKEETYYGAFTGISFDYLLWEKRIPVGLDLNARYYPNFPFQLNYGLHTGFNF